MEATVEKDVQKNDEGFSLIEILIAIAILAVVSLGIMALLPNGYVQITNAGRKATMDHIAQKNLDYLRSIPVSHTDLTAGTHTTTTGMTNFSVSWIVSNGALTNQRDIRLTVAYASSGSGVYSDTHTYTTTITQ
jgi:prepilin-type N-terminal cleavage/methylation domain-containing protein